MQGRLVAADSSAARLGGLADMARRQGLADGFLDVRPGDLRALREGLGAAGLFDRGAQMPLVDLRRAITRSLCLTLRTREHRDSC